MITIFSIPKAFKGHDGVIQRNALASWKRIGPDVRVIMVGNDPGAAETAREFGVAHVPELRTTEYGTPLLSDAFNHANRLAQTPYLMYSNADILYDRSLLDAVLAMRAHSKFLICGRRWDTDITEDISAAPDDIWRRVFSEHESRGNLHGMSGLDYFLFPRAMNLSLPDFAVGRWVWDNWMLWRCRMNGIPLVDATETVVAIHQNHPYAPGRVDGRNVRELERQMNIRAAGGLSNMFTLREANWNMVKGELRRPKLFRWTMASLATLRPYQLALGIKRSLARSPAA